MKGEELNAEESNTNVAKFRKAYAVHFHCGTCWLLDEVSAEVFVSTC